ncbi:hypothetical protein ABRY23_06895 [Melioribacteraceae bacterium 4301-Me]|uniref:hypothetical protein n=1 Tax=Pyranulibacter aquaticus TaxID=3163344 RepID=UPI003595F5B3
MTNIVVDNIYKKPKKTFNTNELTTLQADSIFLNVLNEFAIDSSWISIKKKKFDEDDSTKHEYHIKLPKDLPVPLVIKELSNKLNKDITALVSQENKNFGETSVKIYSNERLKLKAILEPDLNLVRERNNIYFIITDASSLDFQQLKELLKSPLPLTFSLLPSDYSNTIKDTIQNYFKDYSVWLNDAIDDKKYKIEAGYSKELLRSSIQNIITSYKDAVLFIVDSKSKIYNSATYNFIRDYFKSWGIKLYTDTDFILFKSSKKEELISLMKFYANTKDSSPNKIILINKDEFDLLNDELELEKKKGTKFFAVKSYFIKKVF